MTKKILQFFLTTAITAGIVWLVTYGFKQRAKKQVENVARESIRKSRDK